MLSTTNTAVPVVIPSPQHPSSASVPQTLNAFAPAPVNGWNQDNSSAATKSFFDFRPIRTGSNEAVVGDNNNSSTNIPGKAPIRLSTITNTSISAVDATKPRSLSAGRIRMSGGSDLIQGIYDRLGVERGDLATSKMKGSTVHQGDIRQSFKNSGHGTMNEAYTTADSNRSTTRGRTTVQNSADIGTNDDGQARSRSLSRGRQFRSIWPPSESVSTATTTIKYRGTDAALDPILSPNHQRLNAVVCSPDEVVAVMLSPSRRKVHRDMTAQYEDELLVAPKSSPTHATAKYKSVISGSEDKTASSEVSTATDVVSIPGGFSVKERMRAFSEPTKKTTSEPKKAATPARNYPPLIDIFADDKKRYQNDNIGFEEAEEEKKDDDREYSVPGAHQLRQRQISTSVDTSKDNAVTTPTASRGKGASLANAFLASIQTSPTDNAGISPRYGTTFSFAPINEIATEDHGSALDTGSVSILSSVGSHDDLLVSRGNIGSTSHARKSWIDNRSKQQSQQQRGPVTTKAGATVSARQNHFLPSTTPIASNSEQPKQSASTSMIIERLVEERVQTRVAELERRMEQQMRTYMEEMENKMLSIIAAYEKEKKDQF